MITTLSFASICIWLAGVLVGLPTGVLIGIWLETWSRKRRQAYVLSKLEKADNAAFLQGIDLTEEGPANDAH